MDDVQYSPPSILRQVFGTSFQLSPVYLPDAPFEGKLFAELLSLGVEAPSYKENNQTVLKFIKQLLKYLQLLYTSESKFQLNHPNRNHHVVQLKGHRHCLSCSSCDRLACSSSWQRPMQYRRLDVLPEHPKHCSWAQVRPRRSVGNLGYCSSICRYSPWCHLHSHLCEYCSFTVSSSISLRVIRYAQVIGLGNSGCTAQPVCCENNNFSKDLTYHQEWLQANSDLSLADGVVALGCSPISAGLWAEWRSALPYRNLSAHSYIRSPRDISLELIICLHLFLCRLLGISVLV